MRKRSNITNVILALYHILRDEGVSGFIRRMRRKVRISLICFAASGVKSVSLNECVFGLDMIPNNAMKVSLLKKKYENFERQAVLKYVRPEFPVVELGGCIGVVSCVTNRLLDNPDMHVVVEANPHVIPILETNKKNNHCRFEIMNRAIAYDVASVTFSPASDFRGTSLRKTARNSFEMLPVTVPAIELGALVARRNFGGFTLICDIEGHEYELVLREPNIIERVDTLIMETHARLIGEARHCEMMDKLFRLGFRTIDEDSGVIVMRNTAQPSR